MLVAAPAVLQFAAVLQLAAVLQFAKFHRRRTRRTVHVCYPKSEEKKKVNYDRHET